MVLDIIIIISFAKRYYNNNRSNIGIPSHLIIFTFRLKRVRLLENYIIFREHIKYVFFPLTEMVDFTINLINEIYQRRKYTFNILPEYNIIIPICPTSL